MVASPSRWAAALVAVAATAGCAAQQPAIPPSHSTAAEPSPSSAFVGGPAVQWYASKQRTLPKPVNGELLDGSSFDLASLRGTVVVINWWGSWYEPCRRETPHLVRAYSDTRELDVE